MVDSRAKGKRGELAARDQCRLHWFARQCIRAAQSCGAYGADLLNALPGAHVEVKWHAAIGALKFLDQAGRDKKPEEIPVVLMRDNSKDRWVVMFPIECTAAFVAGYLSNKTCNSGPSNDAASAK